jgi:hypothetical protein
MMKRQKELKRQERAQDKAAEREARKREKAQRGPRGPNENDPDIAHIVPGPQPVIGEPGASVGE